MTSSLVPLVKRRDDVGTVPRVRTRFTKVEAEDFLDRMGRMADRLAPALRASVRDLLDDLGDLDVSTQQEIEYALSHWDIVEVVELIVDRLEAKMRRALSPALTSAVREAARMAVQRWPALGGGIELDDVTNPVALSFLEDYPVPLVTEMTDDLREHVRDMVQRGMAEGMGPDDIMDLIKRTKGFSLTSSQWTAVMNYRQELEAGLSSAHRALVDRRFTTTTMTPEKIDRMVERYGERWLDHRALMIARTESMRALNTGVWLSMDDAARRGFVDRDTLVRRWIPAHDNATGGGPCPSCLEVALLNENGVGMDEPFLVPAGTLMQPPLHPNCRCVVATRPRLYADETFSWPPAGTTDDL